MLDPRLLYDIDPARWERLAGVRLPLVHLLAGYVDAGLVGAALAESLRERSVGVLATFDIDQLHDFRSRRPVMEFDTDRWSDCSEFSLQIHLCEDDQGAEFLLLVGPEPDTQWGRAAAALTQIVDHVDSPVVLTVSGAPMAVPHTRPTLVTSHSTRSGVVEGNPPGINQIAVPGSFSAFWEFRLGRHGRFARGFAVHVPHYLAQARFEQAIVEGLGRLERAAHLDLGSGALAAGVATNLDEINAEMWGSDEVQQVVAALEVQYDQAPTDSSELPDADQLGAEFERFLAEQDENGEER